MRCLTCVSSAISTFFAIVFISITPERVFAGQAAAAAQEQERPSLANQIPAAGERVIELDSTGPKLDAFKSFDLPFLVALWLCVPEPPARSPNEDDAAYLARIEGELVRVYNKPERRRNCAEALRAGRATPEVSEAFRKARAEGGTDSDGILIRNADQKLAIRVRLLQPPAVNHCRERVFELRPGDSEVLSLGEFRQCGIDGRLNFLVLRYEGAEPAGEPRATSGFALSFNLPKQLTTPQLHAQAPETSCVRRYAIHVNLDSTGIASRRFRNPRWPPYLGPNSEVLKELPTEIAFQSCTDLVFTNELVDRRFVVTFTGIRPAARWALMDVPGIATRCEGESCTASLIVGPGVTGTGVRLIALRRTYLEAQPPQREPVTFNVAFFEDDREPTYARGFFSLVQFHQMSERRSSTQWSAAVSADVGSIPDIIQLDPRFQGSLDEPPEIRANDSRAQGAVRVTLKQNVGARASGEFELRLRSGELGGSDPTVAATKYRMDVNLLSGLILTGGRFVVAAPGETIAVSEAGDNFGFRAGPLAANYIFRKQVRNALPDILDPNATETDRDHSTGVIQLNGLPLPGYRSINFDLIGLRGERSLSRSVTESAAAAAARVDRNYWTFGSEANWLIAKDWRWTSSLYYSQVRSDYGQQARQLASDKGQGWTMLHTLTYTNFDGDVADLRQGVDWTVQGRFGLGSKDDPSTDMERESYSGEANPFAPDVLFLSAIVPALEANRLLTKGLADKQYVGLAVTRPIRRVAEFLRLPPGEISSASASLRLHRYWVRGGLGTRGLLATEINASASAEIPRGIKVVLTAAHLRHGSALTALQISHPAGSRSVLDRNLWSLIAQISATLQ